MRGSSVRLLIDAREIQGSGIASTTRGIIQHVVPELLRRGLEVGVVAPPNDLLAAVPDAELLVSRASMYGPRLQLDLPRLARRYNADSVWSTHYPVPLGGAPIRIVTVHDVLHLVKPSSRRQKAYAEVMLRSIRRRAVAIHTVSQFTKDQLVALGGIAADRIDVCPFGIDDEWYQPTPLTLPTDSSQRYFVIVGNLKPHKNVDFVVDAFSTQPGLRSQRLIVIGRPDTASSGCSANVTFTGYLPVESVRSIVRSATALIAPSLFEGFGMTPIEAMSSGVPAIVADIPAAREACGDTAVYFDPRDTEQLVKSIQVLVSEDASERERIVERGQRWADRYRWERRAGRLADLLEHRLAGW